MRQACIQEMSQNSIVSGVVWDRRKRCFDQETCKGHLLGQPLMGWVTRLLTLLGSSMVLFFGAFLGQNRRPFTTAFSHLFFPHVLLWSITRRNNGVHVCVCVRVDACWHPRARTHTHACACAGACKETLTRHWHLTLLLAKAFSDLSGYCRRDGGQWLLSLAGLCLSRGSRSSHFLVRLESVLNTSIAIGDQHRQNISVCCERLACCI